MKRSILLFGALMLTVSMAFSQAAFFTEDFGSGIPGGWTNGGVDKTGTAHTGMWKWTNTGNHSGVGWPTTALHSPTAANGWVKFDSDSLDGAGNGGCPAPQRGYLTSTAINCTGHTNVLLQFYDLYFSFDGNPRVIVSNGTTSDTINIHSDYDFSFGITPNPSYQQFDVSSVAANQSAVTITLLWDLTTQGYFYWQVDDISLLDAPGNDLQIYNVNSVNVDGTFDYYRYPLSELDSIGYYAYGISVGANDQYDARVALQIKEGASVVFTDTSPLGIILPYGIDSPLIGTNSYLPATIGTYTSYLSVFSDSANGLPYNAGDTTTFYVTDSVFAVDNGVYGGSFITYLPAADAQSGVAATQEWASVFYLPNADTVTSITAAFDAVQSANSATVQGNIYSLPANYQGFGSSYTCTPVIQTEQKLITQNQMTHANTGGAITVTTVNLRIDKATGAANAAVLQPGFYAVSITPVNDSLISLVNAFAGTGVYGAPGGEIESGLLNVYTNTHFILRMNLGHGLNLLQASFTRSPGISPIKVGQAVTFYGSDDGTGDANATYSWTVIDDSIGVDQQYNTATFKDTFLIAGTYTVCLTVTDGGDTAMACSQIVVRNIGVGINEVAPLSQVAIVPNPTTGLVKISADGVNGPVSISVVSMLGEVVASFEEEANGGLNKTYDLSSLSNGIYLVKISNNDNVVTKKLSVSKQ